MKWGWLFRTYVQWHAIAFLLSELCVRTKGEAVERAWRALEATAGRWWFPLSDSSVHGKGQQGCLWKPLRKLLAKAKAAREKELALERASRALRNGMTFYSGLTPGTEQLVNPVTVNQPASEKLDQMLRPSAPKLGEGVPLSHPSWPVSPSLPNGQRPLPNGFASPSARSQQMKNSGSPGQEFSDLTNFGLDHIVQYAMEDMAFDGNSVFDFSNLQANGSTPGTSSTNSSQLPVSNGAAAVPPNTMNSTATAMNSAHGTFGDTMFGNADFGSISPTTMMNGNAAPTSGSPTMEGDNMDWTMWDVSQVPVTKWLDELGSVVWHRQSIPREQNLLLFCQSSPTPNVLLTSC